MKTGQCLESTRLGIVQFLLFPLVFICQPVYAQPPLPGNCIKALEYGAGGEMDKARLQFDILPTISPQCEFAKSSVELLSGVSSGKVSRQAAIHIFRAWIHMSNGEFREMAVEGERAIQADQNYGQGYNVRGAAFGFLGEFDNAIKDFDQSLALNPNDPVSYNARGNAKKAKEDIKGAITDFNRAIELGYTEAHIGRSGIYMITGDFEKGFWEANRAVELHPGIAEAWSARAFFNVAKGNTNKAKEDLEKALFIDPESPEVWFAKLAVHDMAQEKAAAIDAMRKFLKVAPPMMSAQINFARQRLQKLEAKSSQTLTQVLPDALALFFVVAGDFKEEPGNLSAQGSVRTVLRDIGFKVTDGDPRKNDARLRIDVKGENIPVKYNDGKMRDADARITGLLTFQTPDGQSERRTFYGTALLQFFDHQKAKERFSRAFEGSSFWDELGRILTSTYGPLVGAKYWKQVALFNSIPFVRVAALVELGKIEKPSKDLIALILNTEAGDSAIKDLGETGETALFDLANAADTTTRRNSIRVLGLFNSKRSTEALVRALGDENSEVRRTSLLVLRTGKRDFLTDLLVDSMRHGTNIQRQAAAEGLAFVNDDRAIEPLVRATRDADKHIQKEANTSLILKGNKAIPVLGGLLKNGDTTVKAIIPGVLVLIGSCQALSVLETALEDPAPDVRESVRQAISAVKGTTRSAC